MMNKQHLPKPDSTESPLLSAAWRNSGAEPNPGTTAIAFQKASLLCAFAPLRETSPATQIKSVKSNQIGVIQK